ncbi:MAG: substrate-binding periplasmic protein [Desulfocapsaceae bacterium]
MKGEKATYGLMAILLLSAFTILAPLSEAAEKPKGRVGVYECPPFVIDNGDGTFSGLSMVLWQHIAKELQVDYEISAHSLDGILQGVVDGTIDVGVSCVSITPARETVVDFSHSFYETHLAVAVKQQGPLTYIKNLLTDMDIFRYFLIFIGAAFIIGLIFFLLERKDNEKFYITRSKAGNVLEILMMGVVSIVKGPFSYHLFSTMAARVLAVTLVITSTFFVAGITALLASSLTLKSLGSDIQGVEDLRTRTIGAIEASVSAQQLKDFGISHLTFSDVHELLDALDRGRVEAVITDDAVLRYQLKQERENGRYQDLTILPYQLAKQNYGFVLPEDHPNEERLNQALLKIRKSPEWKQEVSKFLK